MPEVLWLKGGSLDLLSDVEIVNQGQCYASYGKSPSEGHWSIRVYYLKDEDKFISDTFDMEHLSEKVLYRNKNSSFEAKE